MPIEKKRGAYCVKEWGIRNEMREDYGESRRKNSRMCGLHFDYENIRFSQQKIMSRIQWLYFWMVGNISI